MKNKKAYQCCNCGNRTFSVNSAGIFCPVCEKYQYPIPDASSNTVIVDWEDDCVFEEDDLENDEIDTMGLYKYIENTFENLRFNPSTHLGLGDIHLTIGVQEEILDIVKEICTKAAKG